jgi:radical SAM superfamily enzyme YgiQ (UPF0313 family)
MRYLLVNPFYPVSENPSPPLGLAFLAAALERAGIEVRVLDLVVFPYTIDLLEELLNDFQPDIVGVTSVTMSFDQAIGVVQDVKRIAPGLVTVMGGPHVSFRARETMEEYPALDFIVMGEGEEAIVELAGAVEKGAGYGEIAGLAWRDGDRINLTAARPPGIDVDTLPRPARHLLPLGRYRTLGMAISMTSSRGCPFNCIFCVGRKMVGAKVRYRDPISVVDELEYLSSLNFIQVNMADDLFTANKKHCLGVCDEILRRGLKTKWTSFARVDTVSPEVLTRMKEAGCTAVSFGVETGNREILKTIRKGITLEQVEAAVKMCVEVGITPHASFILGLPGETPETLKETVAYGEKLKSLGVSHGFHLLAPFPGTRVREESQAYGLKILTDDWREYHANRAIVATETVSREMLDDVVIQWEKNFDAYLGWLKERLEAGLASEEEAWPLINLERIVLIYDLMMARVIEEKGSWPAADDASAASEHLDRLVDRVKEATPKSRELVRDTLSSALEKGHLRRLEAQGLVRWEWVDYL